VGAERAGPGQLLVLDHLEHAAGVAMPRVEAIRALHADPEYAAWTSIELAFGDLVGPRGEPALEMLGIGVGFPHQVDRGVDGAFQHQVKLVSHCSSPCL